MLNVRRFMSRKPVALALMAAFLFSLVVTNVALASDASAVLVASEADGLVGGFELSCEAATALVAATVGIAAGGGPVTAAAIAVAGGLWLISKCLI